MISLRVQNNVGRIWWHVAPTNERHSWLRPTIETKGIEVHIINAVDSVGSNVDQVRPVDLRVSTDELLGVKAFKDGTSPKTARLLKRLKKVEALPVADRRAVLKLVDALLETRRRAGR